MKIVCGRPCDGIFYVAVDDWWRQPDIRLCRKWLGLGMHDSRTESSGFSWEKHWVHRRWINLGFGYAGYNFDSKRLG